MTQSKQVPPATIGVAKKDNIFHWSIDELIEYRSTGTRPKMIIDDNYIFRLAQMGISIKNICGLFSITEETFCSNERFLSAHQRGRSELATKLRSVITEQALSGNLMAAQYLDRYMGGDSETRNVNLEVSQRPLQEASTETLIDVVVHESQQNTDTE